MAKAKSQSARQSWEITARRKNPSILYRNKSKHGVTIKVASGEDALQHIVYMNMCVGFFCLYTIYIYATKSYPADNNIHIKNIMQRI